MKYLASLLLIICASFLSISVYADNSYQGPISDIHSHIKAGMDLEAIIPLMDKNNVDSMVIMRRDSKRMETGGAPLTRYEELKAFSQRYPGRVHLGIGMQFKAWMKQDASFMSKVERWAKSGDFSLIGELVLHDDRRNQDISASGSMFKRTLKIASAYQMPLLIHTFYDFRSERGEKTFLKTLRKHKDVTVIWAHMCGFSTPTRIKALFEEFPRLHCDLAYLSKLQYITGEGVVDEDFNFTPEWKELIESYPERFLVGIDVTTQEQYLEEYSDYVNAFRTALGSLSPAVARKVATENYHRLFAER